MLDKDILQATITTALAEDIGSGDVTSRLIIPEGTMGMASFVARKDMIACGAFIPAEVYRQLDASVKVDVKVKEGQKLQKGDVLAVASGPAVALLTGERVALNLIQRLCGVASLTARYVEAVRGTKAVILDTRKTMPGLRLLDKYAVRVGGGTNHRMRLDDMVLIKDNHIALCGGIAAAVAKVRAGSRLPLEVECDTLAQVEEALMAKPDRILLDNMSLADLKKAVQLVGGKIPLEASGGVSLETVRAIAETGVDYISVGKLTYSASNVDIAVDMAIKS